MGARAHPFHRQETTSAKQVLDVAPRASTLASFPNFKALGRRLNRNSRLYVRHHPEDRMMLADRAAAWPGSTLCSESSGFTGGAYSHAGEPPYLRCRLSVGSPASP